MNDREMINLKTLTNAYATAKIKPLLDELEVAMKSSSGNVVYTRAAADKIIGKFIALAYAQGYKDHADKIEPKRNIFM